MFSTSSTTLNIWPSSTEMVRRNTSPWPFSQTRVTGDLSVSRPSFSTRQSVSLSGIGCFTPVPAIQPNSA